MKLLSRDEIFEAGYQFPKEGLCFNISTEEAEAFKSNGEWVLSKNEVLAQEGGEQSFLYVVIQGQVDLYKADNRRENQKISTLGIGETFGEVAFLKGRVSSVMAQSVGDSLLWRINYECLLQFIVEHVRGGGQLCLNLAGILAGRLVEGTDQVLEIRTELQESIEQLHSLHSEEDSKSKALMGMQQKLANMQHGLRTRPSKKSVFNTFTVVCLTIAFLSTSTLVLLLFSEDTADLEKRGAEKEKILKLEKNEEFFIEIKDKLEADNEDFVQMNEALLEQVKLSDEKNIETEKELAELNDKLEGMERELIIAKDEATRGASVGQVDTSLEPEIPEDFINGAIAWVKVNSTMIFPMEIEIKNVPVALTDKDQLVSVPIAPGGIVLANRLHPMVPGFLIVSQKNSQKLLASVKLENTNFFEMIAGQYVRQMKSQGMPIKNPFPTDSE